MNKFKIKDKVWLLCNNGRPERLNKNRFNDDYDLMAMVIGYVETSPLIKDRWRHYYLKQGYKYVFSTVTRFDGLHPCAHLAKEGELRRYYGHDYDIEFNEIYDDFEHQLKHVSGIVPLEKWDGLK